MYKMRGTGPKHLKGCFQSWQSTPLFHLADYSSFHIRAPFVWENLEFGDGFNDKLALKEGSVIWPCSCLVILHEYTITSGGMSKFTRHYLGRILLFPWDQSIILKSITNWAHPPDAGRPLLGSTGPMPGVSHLTRVSPSLRFHWRAWQEARLCPGINDLSSHQP